MSLTLSRSTRAAGRKATDITGQTFGRLTVLSFAGHSGKEQTWLCRCECGRTNTVRRNNLNSGQVVSCGRSCPLKKQRKFEDLTGQRFAMLTVAKRAPNHVRKKGAAQTMMWECRCDCGVIVIASGTRMRRGVVGSCGCILGTGIAIRSEEARRWAAEAHKRRMESDVVYAVNRRMRGRLGTAMRKARIVKSKRTEDLLGYSFEEAREHLATTMPPGFTWGDFLAGRLEIDHRTPLVEFAITGEDCPAFRAAWALSNLQLLPSRINRQKNRRLDTPWS